MRFRPGAIFPGQEPIRDLLDEPARARIRVQHGGWLQRCVDRDWPGRVDDRRHRRARPAARALRRLWRDAAVAFRSRRGCSTTSCDSCRPSGSSRRLIFLGVAAFILNVALRARVVAAALPDRRAQGARLLESGAGLALHQMGARHCRIGRAGRRRGRRVARLGHDWPLQRVLPVPGARLSPLHRRRRRCR